MKMKKKDITFLVAEIHIQNIEEIQTKILTKIIIIKILTINMKTIRSTTKMKYLVLIEDTIEEKK